MFGDRGDVLPAVSGKVTHAQPIGLGDVAVGLDGVAVVDQFGGYPGAQRLGDLLRAGRVEAGTEPGEMVEHLVHRACFHREPNSSTRQFGAQGCVLATDAVQVVDDGVLGGGGERVTQGGMVVPAEEWRGGRVHGGRRGQGAVAGSATVGRPALFGDLTYVGGLRPHV